MFGSAERRVKVAATKQLAADDHCIDLSRVPDFVEWIRIQQNEILDFAAVDRAEVPLDVLQLRARACPTGRESETFPAVDDVRVRRRRAVTDRREATVANDDGGIARGVRDREREPQRVHSCPSITGRSSRTIQARNDLDRSPGNSSSTCPSTSTRHEF